MSDYATLMGDVSTWLMRDDLDAHIPTFIRLAENRHRSPPRQGGIRVRAMMKRVNLTGDGTHYIELPGDYIDMRRLKYEDDRRLLIQVSPEAMSNRRDVRAAPSSPNLPTYWAIVGGEIEFDVPIGVDGQVEIAYWSSFTPLSGANPTNWLVENGYGAYLYGTLQEASPFIGDDERTQVWTAAYNTHAGNLNEEYLRSLVGGAPRVVVEDAGILP